MKLGMFHSLKDSNYRWFWVGMLVSFSGAQVQQIALSWLVYDMTGSPLALGVVGAAWGLPILLLSPFGGVMADRVPRRRLMIMTECLAGAVSVVLAILVYTGVITMWHLILGSLVRGIAFSFNAPGRQAFVSDLFKDSELMNAIAINGAGVNLMRVLGPAVGGYLIVIIGVAGVFYVSVGCSLVAIFSLFWVHTTRTTTGTTKESWGLFKEGLMYIRKSPTLMALLSLAFIPILFGLPYILFLPVFAADILNVGAPGLGWLAAMSGLGAMAGSLIIASLPQSIRKGKIMVFLALSFGITLLLFAQSQAYILSLVLLVMVGCASMSYISLNNTMLQTTTSYELRGRVMGVYVMTWSLMPLGALPISAIAELTGTPLAISLGGIIIVVFTVLAYLLWPKLRRL